MPHDLALKAMNGIHRLLLTATGGKVGQVVAGMPVLELTTIGRKSGQPRAVMLTSPLQEGDTYVVVASRGGDDHHPAWFLNLRDNPEVEVSIKGAPKQRWSARVATPEERARMWPKIATSFTNYAGYQKRTQREIPLVLLSPA
ncbi:nitroreductase/quinone reductase family protein [Pseudonocardia sp. CA-107938]|uniref:nitroreductase/quinone reductase family protein n=1 Tax=Pseudonocardia sp. CA-107938 TaxID=3240021 RepID=UPI003D8D8CC5